jgi:predicted helicase
MWNEFPKKGAVGDVGVDLVAEERYFPGEYCGIQCKFYLPENTVSKKEIDSFYTAVGNPIFTSGLIVSHDRQMGAKRRTRPHPTKPSPSCC